MHLHRFLVELGGVPVGVAIQERKGCRFYAASREVTALDKRIFASAADVEDACRKLISPGRAQGPYIDVRSPPPENDYPVETSPPRSRDGCL